MASNLSLYCYQPLPSGVDKIRLLNLLPSEDEDGPIQCKLVNYSLTTTGRRRNLYEALSYVWGSEQKPESISIDGSYLPITLSLHEALLRLRDHALGRYLWIDAVCINQDDTMEKMHQIGLMAQIYGYARQTIVWLGNTGDDSEKAIEIVRAAAWSKPTISNLHNPSGNNYSRHSLSGYVFPDHESQYESLDYNSSYVLSESESSGGRPYEHGMHSKPLKQLEPGPGEKAVVALLARPWFRRIWVSEKYVPSLRSSTDLSQVLQEVAVARRVSIVCDFSEIEGPPFAWALEL
jgi:hypothetical protein